jgi:hypothetical protein
MRDNVYEGEKNKKAVKNPVDSAVTRFKRHIYVLPSGRIMKVLVDDESELTGSAARAW